MIIGVSFHRERMRAAAADELIAATDVAALLVRLGMPVREAHGVVAGLVRTAIDAGKQLSELTVEELAAVGGVLAEHREQLDAVLYPRAPGLSPRSPKGVPRLAACASSSCTPTIRSRIWTAALETAQHD